MSQLRASKRPSRKRRRIGERTPAQLQVRDTIVDSISGQRVEEPIFPLASTMSNKVHNFIQSVPTTFLSSSATLNTTAQFSFALSDLDQSASFAALFDQYRLMMVEVVFAPHSNSQTAQGSYDGIITSVIDYDDATAFASQGAAMDYSNAVTNEGYTSFKRTFIPHLAIAAYTGTFVGFANKSQQWIDTGSTGVKHYGMKIYWTPSSAICTYDIFFRYWLQFRNVR